MEVLNIIEPSVYPHYPQENKRIKAEKEEFERIWETAISGDEFERRVHKHIDKLYAQNKQ